MAKITQDTRLLELETPLGPNALLIRYIHGREAISELYNYQVEAFASNEAPVDFSELMGQPVRVRVALNQNGNRYFHGIVKSVMRGARGQSNTAYRLDVVPTLWLLTQRAQSRIFQQLPVPDILKKVLEGLDVDWQITGAFEPRDYCVQYRETDFDFASRLMEEEGIFYFFRHKQDGHQLVVANSSQSFVELPHESNLYYDEERGGVEQEEIIYSWEKYQTLTPGKVTLWDHCFELPHKNLEAQHMVDEELAIGEVTHKLKVGGNDRLEVYDFPGAYAQRFDGVSPSGGDRTGDLQKIYEDNVRTVKLRMQQETIAAIQITGLTGYLNMLPGHKFVLGRHYSDDDTYVITHSSVSISQAGSYSGGDDGQGPPPETSFSCIPEKFPYVPRRVTAKPHIYGTQTALVVGPAGDEIFTDKYGRIKVQFFWDRQGAFDGTSSCWVRVGTPWAGKNWGMIHIPRVGQEVIVAFEEGDPDQPMVVGSVYNADMMPPHALPDNKTQSGIKSRSTPNAGPQNLNEIRFEDKKGQEHIFVHGEKDVHFRAKGSYLSDVGGTHDEKVHGNATIEYMANKSHRVAGDYADMTHGKRGMKSADDMTIVTGTTLGIKAPFFLIKSDAIKVTTTDSIKVESGADVWMEATGFHFSVGGSSITIKSDGIYIKGPMVYINSGSSSIAASNPDKPADVKTSDAKGPMKPGETGAVDMGKYKSQRAGAAPPGADEDAGNRHDPNAEENKEKTHWVEVELLDEMGKPVAGEPCQITLPNGSKSVYSTDAKGLIRIEKIDGGNCSFRWLNLDQDAVEKK
jgi:type VI secretion system secreted protein VgrG